MVFNAALYTLSIEGLPYDVYIFKITANGGALFVAREQPIKSNARGIAIH